MARHDLAVVVPEIHVEQDCSPDEVTGVCFVDEHSRRNSIDETWENNGCMPNSSLPLPEGFFKDCEITRKKVCGIINE